MKRRTCGALLLAMAGIGGSAEAGAFRHAPDAPPGYVEVKLADLKETPQYKQRLADRSGFLAVSADFNGDGARDEARILVNRTEGIALVVVAVMSGKLHNYVLRGFPPDVIARTGIRLAPASRTSGGRPGLSIFEFDGTFEQREYFQGGKFVTR